MGYEVILLSGHSHAMKTKHLQYIGFNILRATRLLPYTEIEVIYTKTIKFIENFLDCNDRQRPKSTLHHIFILLSICLDRRFFGSSLNDLVGFLINCNNCIYHCVDRQLKYCWTVTKGYYKNIKLSKKKNATIKR